jgi:uncharacterized protein (TIGR02246 family)
MGDENSEVEAAVTRLLNVFIDGWNAGSGAQLAAAFALDADFTNVMGLRAQGRDVIARGHDEILAGFFKGTRMAGQVDHVRFPRPDVAVVDATLTLERADGRRFRGPARSKAKYVAVRSEEAWSIISFGNTIPFERPTAGPIERLLALAQGGA